MVTKIYDFIKKFIKECYKEIIVLFLFIVLINIPLNYYIIVGGGLINIDDRIKMSEEYTSQGSLNMAYVSELKATIPSYIISYLFKDWERVPLSSSKVDEKETMDDIDVRNEIYLEESKQNAIYLAYKYANKSFKINKTKYVIMYVDRSINNNLYIGDEILKIDGNELTSMKQYQNIVRSKESGDYVTLLISRNKKEKEVKVKIHNVDNSKITGISVSVLYDYSTEPPIDFSFNSSEGGPSGGLMLTLAIYNKLIKEDITKGLKIVGTGTIDSLGNVGEIGGVKYKLMGAVSKKADIFIAPEGSNYDECIKLKNEKNYNIKIISAKTFSQVLEELKNI